MATYTITLNERTAKGKALMEYLQALGVLVKRFRQRQRVVTCVHRRTNRLGALRNSLHLKKCSSR